MKLVDRLTDSAHQSFTLTNIDDGSDINCVMRYLPTQQSWMIDIENVGFRVNGIHVSVSPNILRQWSSLINFGIGFATTDNLEIFFVEDFKSARASMFLLSSADMDEAEASLYG